MKRDRAWRRGKKETLCAKRHKLWLRNVTPSPMSCDHPVNHQPSRWAKQHPMDCGNPQCAVCKYPDPGVDRYREAKAPPLDQDAA
jgi:hypothetical protein